MVADFKPSEEQAKILNHDPHQHARVLAGPGTGKSATMVAWVGEVLGSDDAPSLRLLTFTRAATAELADKVLSHEALAAQRPSTVHSFAISVLLQNPGTGDFPQPLRLADDWEQDQVIYLSLARRANVNKRRIGNLVREMASAWESLREEEDPKVDPKERARFVGAWNEHRTVFGYTLLAELPYALMQALQDHPDLEGAEFDLVIVDEYQDLNSCDLQVLKLIAVRGAAIIGAGDDDQSIYSFRKADPEGIRRFLDDYSDAGDYPLSISRRCGKRIIEWATHVIEGDPDRPDKPRLTPVEGSPDGEVALLSFAGQVAEPKGIAQLVQHLIDDEKVPPSEILILLRGDHNGQFSGPIKKQLADLGIECSDPDALKLLLAEPQNRRLIEVIRLVTDRDDSIAWASLLTLTAGISSDFIDYVYESARSAGERFSVALHRLRAEEFPGAARPSANKTIALVDDTTAWLDEHRVPENEPSEGWGQWIVEIAGGEVAPSPSTEFAELLTELDGFSEVDQGLGRYLGQIAPLGKDLAASKSEGVRVMTMANSKGLTVRATIVGAVEEDIVPRPDCLLDEERRLLYVAMTRSTEYLYVTWARQRRGPTARSGRGGDARRRASHFLQAGPVESQDGETYMSNRWAT